MDDKSRDNNNHSDVNDNFEYNPSGSVASENTSSGFFKKAFFEGKNEISKLLMLFKNLKNKKYLVVLLVLILFIGLVALKNRPSKKSIQVRQEEQEEITSEDDGFEKVVIPEREQPFFKLETKEVRRFGILPAEDFVLKTIEPVTASYIRSVIEDPENFSIEETGDKEITIKNRNALDLDEPISIVLNTQGQQLGGYTFDRNYSWAFQAQGKFAVASTVPGNEKTQVPVNTGIEITFNQDDFKDPVRLIQIEPEIQFRSQIIDETFVVIPDKPLDHETVYTVRLKSGLRLNSRDDQISEDYEFSFQTEEKKELSKPKPWISIHNNFVQSSPTEPFITRVSTANWNNDIKVNIKVYQFGNASEFVSSREEYDEAVRDWQVYYPNRYKFSEGLGEVLNEDVSVQEEEQIQYIQLSKNLDPGYYLMEFRVEGELVSNQVWYQSSEIAGFISLGRDDIIVWANNLASKSAINGALVRSISTGGTWITNADGVAKFPSALEYFDEDNDYFEISDAAGNSVVLPVESQKGNTGPGETSADDFWSYLYTEKIYYLSNDTVNIWGVIKDRDTGVVPNARLVLFHSEEIYSEPLSPSSDGSFITKFPLNDAPEGWYQLQLKVGDTTVEQLSFTVRQYVKPDMKIEISSDKKAIFTDEEVKFEVKTSFFDETPGANIDLNVHEYQSGKKTTSKTDDNGVIEYTYRPSYKQGYYYPRYEGISAIPGITQESIVEGSGSVRVFGPKIMMTTDRDQESDKASFTATFNKVDLTGINSGTTNDPKGDPVGGKDINVLIEEHWTERVETGFTYSFIEKLTYKTYKYERKTEEKENLTLTTDSFGEISHNFDMTIGRSYTVEISVNDEDGKKVERTLYFYASKWVGSYGYYGSSSEDTNVYIDLAFGRDTNVYSVGEDVYVKLTQQGDDYKKLDDDKFLFTKSQRGRQDAFVEDVPQFSFQFSQSDVPNTFVSAVVFNGRIYKRAEGYCQTNWVCGGGWGYYHYYYSHNTFKGIYITHKKEDSELDIEIKTTKAKYEPGERVDIQAIVTKDGNPAGGASVNLAMVDAALAAIGGVREPSVLASVHEAIPHQIYYVYTTHEPIIPDTPGAEKGGGGGDRDNFKDTAAFYQAQTDGEGVANFSFELPDNITTWIVYMQAINGNLQAGQSESSIIVTKDFFVTSKFPKNILVGDSAFISANSFGVALNENSTIDYSVLFNDGGSEIDSQQAQEKAFVEKDFRIPELEEGTYDVIVRGKYSDMNDGVRLPLEVVNSRIRQEYSVKHNVDEGGELSDLITDDHLEDEPIMLVVSDEGKGKFFYTLRDYCYRGWSNRLEKRIVSKRSDTLLRDKFDYEECRMIEPFFSEFQGADGGLSQVVWGGSVLDTSLWAVIVAPDEFDQDKLVKYFDDVYENSQGDRLHKIRAGWALSLLGESKLRELKAMIPAAISFDEKVYLGIALAQLGDREVARGLFLDILADYAYELHPYIRIDSTQDRGASYEDFVVETSKALLLGELVDDKYNDRMYEYIDNYRGTLQNYLIDLSDIEYIDNAIATLPDSDTQYSLTTTAGTISETLDKGKSEWYELTSNDIDQFEFSLETGKADLLAKYLIDIDVLKTKSQDKRLSIKRTITEAKNDDGVIRPGDIVKITLELTLDLDNAPKCSYQIKDSLPSGLTYLSSPGSFGFKDAYYARETTGNTIVFNTYSSKWIFKEGKQVINYYAKASAVGEYRAEPAVFQSLKELTVFSMTDEGTVVVE
ncbi:Ig-like domain-containing protein [Candidatus Woesebacteria bacterium]|nr:Ig-like domain-containing protein [Candidatus Woesebacteria bacterium]